MNFLMFATLMLLFHILLVTLAITCAPKPMSVCEQLNEPVYAEVYVEDEGPIYYDYAPPIKLTDSQRAMVEGVVFAEHGNGTLEEQKAVAQVIHDRALLWGMTIEDVLNAPKQFAKPSTREIPPLTKVAVSEIFDFGMMQYDSNVTHFYNYNQCSPSWANSDQMVEVGRGDAHRFMVKKEDLQ